MKLVSWIPFALLMALFVWSVIVTVRRRRK